MAPSVVTATPDDVAAALLAASEGHFPVDDGTVEVVAAPIGRAHGVIAFSAHFFICAPVSVAWVADHLDTSEFAASHGPVFLTALAAQVDADIGALDVVLAGRADGAAHRALDHLRDQGLQPRDDATHPRVRRARRYRDDVQVWSVDEDAWLVVGRGVTGRWEAAFEVGPGHRGRGTGTALAAAARALVPTGDPTFVEVSPGNVASLRAVLAAGYRAVGSEVLLPPRHEGALL